jgi:chitodextrinase/O-glycosyl hydrolase
MFSKVIKRQRREMDKRRDRLLQEAAYSVRIEPLESRCLLSSVSVNSGQTLQTIQGLGGNYSRGSFTNTPTDAVGALTLTDLAPSVVRFSIPLQEWEPTSDGASPTTFANAVFQDTGEVHQTFLMLQTMQQKGIHLTGAIWDLPNWMVSNPSSTTQRTIAPAMVGDAIQSLAAFLVRARDTYGVTIDAVSFNEANGGFNIKLTSQDEANFIKQAGPILAGYNLPAKWVVGDVDRTANAVSYITPILQDPAVLPYVAAVGYHTYFSSALTPSDFSAIATLANQYSLPVWATEVQYGPTNLYAFSSWENARELAKVELQALAYSQATVADVWEYVDDFPLTSSLGVGYPSFYAVKQLSDFLPAGSQVVQSSTDDPNLLTLSAQNLANGHFTTDILSTGTTDSSTTLSGIPNGSYTLYRTSANENMAAVATFNVTNGSLILPIKAQSLNTLVNFASANPLPPTAAGTGTGLTANYYQSKDLSGPAIVTRVDPTVNFNWGNTGPWSPNWTDNFSVRWTGSVQADFSETYTFYTRADDGVRLWVNNQLIINDWNDHTATTDSASIALVAGQSYNIKLEYYDDFNAAEVELGWSSASTPQQIIPQSKLFPNFVPDNTPPTQPGLPVQGTTSSSTIAMTWPISTDAVGVDHYDIFRNNVKVGSSMTNSFADSGLTAATSYHYTVQAFDAVGNPSAISPELIATTSTVASVKLAGTFIGTSGSYQSLGNTGAKALDLNTTTFFDGPGPNGNWVGLDLGAPATITSVRFYPRATYASRMVGGIFQASNDPTFTTGVVNLYTITTAPAQNAYTQQAVNAPSLYRYIRYLGPTNSYGNIAELEFYGIPPDTSPPTQPSNMTLSNVTATSTAISWTASTDDVGVVRYDIFRNNTKVGSSTTNSYTDFGLSPTTAYNYTVKAFDAAGNPSAVSATLPATTAPDTTSPSQPNAPTRSTVTDSTISLTWSPSTDDVGVVRYDIFREGTKIGSSNTTTYTDSGLAPLTKYDYTVEAFDAAGNGSIVSSASTLMTSADTIPPGPPGTPTLTGSAQTSVSISWTAASDDIGVIRYDIYRGGTTPVGSSTTLSYTDNTVSGSTSYSYTVKAVDAAGNSSSASGALAVTTPGDTTPPSAPGAPLQGVVTDTTIALSWAASTDDTGVVRYDILRGGTTVGSSTTLSFTDINLSPSTQYSYSIKAFDAAGNSTAGASAFATTAADTTPPGSPGTPTLNSATTAAVSISWTAASDDVGVVRYDIFRGGTTPVGSSTTLSFTDNTVSASSSYSYTVKAVDAAGNSSAASGAIAVTTPGDSTPPSAPGAPVAGVVTDSTIALSWAASTDNVGVVRYDILRGGVKVGSSTTLSFTDIGLQPSTTYNYSIQAFDAAGNSTIGSVASGTTAADTTPPGSPGTPVVGTITSSSIAFSWAAATDDIGVVRYDIFRNGGATKIGSSTTLNYLDSSLTASTSYSYTVKAIDAAGNSSAASASMTASTSAASNTPAKLNGTVIGTAGSYNNGGNIDTKAFDGDPNTFFDGPTPNGVWAGLDLGTPTVITKIRFSPRASWASRMAGGIFQGSNTADFSSGDVTLYTVPSTPANNPTFTQITITNTTAFRYVRYLSPANGYCNVAEIEFWGAPPVTDNTPPSQPTALTPGTKTDTTLNFSWTASTDDVGVVRYDIFRNGGTTRIGTTTSTSFTDIGLSPTTAYSYTVQAFDAAGNASALSAALPMTTIADANPPTAPGAPVAGTTTTSSITFSWAAASDDVGVVRYDIFRNGSATAIGSSTTLSFTDINLTASTPYSYTVKAVDAAGNSSAASGSTSITTASANTSVKLTGTVIGTAGSFNNSGNTRDKALDGNVGTYFDAANPDGNWVGYDLGSTKTITRIRYVPRLNWAGRMVGGKIQVSSTPDFSSDVVTLYTITAQPAGNPTFTDVTISNNLAYRYVRYLSPNGSYGNVAELEFYGF